MRRRAPLPDIPPSIFHRLESVQARLVQEQLPGVLDAACKTWYVGRTATAVAPHLLELYRRQLVDLFPTQGLEACAPPARPLLALSTTPTVQLSWQPTAVETVQPTLAQELAASDDASGWRTIARRVAIDPCPSDEPA